MWDACDDAFGRDRCMGVPATWNPAGPEPGVVEPCEGWHYTGCRLSRLGFDEGIG